MTNKNEWKESASAKPLTYFEYAVKIREARILGMGKALLWFYANVYTWEEQGRSFYEEARVAAHTGFSVSAIQKWRKYLENLGWLEVIPRGRRQSPFVGVRIGKDDPNFEGKCYSRWRPSKRGLSPKEISNLSREELEQILKSNYEDRRRPLRQSSTPESNDQEEILGSIYEVQIETPGDWYAA